MNIKNRKYDQLLNYKKYLFTLTIILTQGCYFHDSKKLIPIDIIEEVAKLGVQINIDNLSILEQFGTKHPKTPVCIRINPHVMTGGNTNISVGHIDSKFGISIHQIPLLLRIVKNTKMTINGIHMHTGSDILDIDVFLYASEIFVFTPNGDLKSLPQGATPVDFAFNIHTEIGMHTRGAKINGKIVPLSYRLRSGDQIEIITSEKSFPNPSWLDYVITSRARARIRS